MRIVWIVLSIVVSELALAVREEQHPRRYWNREPTTEKPENHDSPESNRGSSSRGSSNGIPALGSYRIDRSRITLSGFSSGGTFAQMLQLSYSSLFRGIAVFSHTYYHCGPGNGIELDYDNACTTLGGLSKSEWWDPNATLRKIEEYRSENLIEDTGNLRGKKLYVYAGTNNWLFTTDQSLRILDIYSPFLRNPQAIFTRVQTANLSFPSDVYGVPCEQDSTSQGNIANCGLSGSYDALKFLLGESKITKPEIKLYRRQLQPQQFNQREFFPKEMNATGMDNIGYIYVPRICKIGRTTKCLLHFYFHGCSLGREFVSDTHLRRTGFLELAEANRMIVVFPQAISMLPQNEIGCWDTYGVTGSQFATQRGAQVGTVRNILRRILEHPSNNYQPRRKQYNAVSKSIDVQDKPYERSKSISSRFGGNFGGVSRRPYSSYFNWKPHSNRQWN